MLNNLKLLYAIRKLAGKTKGFVALKPDAKSAENISNFIKSLGISDYIPADKLHMTVVYDPRESIYAEYTPNNNSYKAEFDKITDIGTPGHDYYSICIKFIAPEIALRHKNLIAAGFDSKYKSFIPHMSLKYKPSDSDIKLLKANSDKIKALCDNISFSDEYTEAITGE